MATLEDKILGEKLHNYCSSSEESDDENSDSESQKKPSQAEPSAEPPPTNKWEGTSTNTGPKGVIKDWQRYKQLEHEKREEDNREKIALMKKLTLSVKSALDEEREKAAEEDPDLAELLDDDFLMSYQKQRMKEMLEQINHNKKFGELIVLRDGQEFLDAIDKEDKSVLVIVHIYEDKVEACRTMNSCLKTLCQVYSNVKFCAIKSSLVGMSNKFKIQGVPALLVYKAGNLIGNFIKLAEELGNDFYTEDVQNYLVEHGMLEDKSCTPLIIKSGANNSDSE